MDAADLYGGHLIKCKSFVIGEAARRKRDPGFILVAINHFASFHDAIQLAAPAVECGNEGPPKILMRVAKVGQLPVENGSNFAVFLEKISNAIIAVNNRYPRWYRTVLV